MRYWHIKVLCEQGFIDPKYITTFGNFISYIFPTNQQRCWNIKILDFIDIGKSEYWNIEILEYTDIGIFNVEIWEYSDF